MQTLAELRTEFFETVDVDFTDTFNREVRRLERCRGRHAVTPMLSIYVVHQGTNESKPDRLAIWVGERYKTAQARLEQVAEYGTQYAEARLLVPFVTLLCEAWTVQGTPERLNEIDAQKLLPSQCPDRIEIVHLAGMSLLQQRRLVYRELKRDKRSRICALGDIMEVNLRNAEGIFHAPVEAFMDNYLRCMLKNGAARRKCDA